VLTAVEKKGGLLPTKPRDKKLQDGISTVGSYRQRLFHRLADLPHGVILQDSEHPDELPGAFSFPEFFATQASAQGVEAFRQVEVRQRTGMIQSPGLALQQRQVVAVIEENPLLAPTPRMLGYNLVVVAENHPVHVALD